MYFINVVLINTIILLYLLSLRSPQLPAGDSPHSAQPPKKIRRIEASGKLVTEVRYRWNSLLVE